MRIAVEHVTHYRFSQPQSRVVQLLRLTPDDTMNQTVVSWRIDVDCDVRLREKVDGFGNKVTMLYAEGPLEGMTITVEGQVLTTESSGVVRGSNEPLPAELFLRDTPRTQVDAELTGFAQEARGDCENVLDCLHRWNAALHVRFPDAPDQPDSKISAAKAFADGKPNSRDLAHIFIAGARAIGIPARYVSGYRYFQEKHCAPHGWAEAWVLDFGWVGFDPSAGMSPDETYVRVAVGLDADSAAAVSGSRMGSGEEVMDVDLQVEQLGTDA